MRSLSAENFGLVIAYLLPGFVALIGVSFFSDTVQAWFSVTPPHAATVAGFLYVTLASIVAGMTVSAIRFHLVDRIHHFTGIRHPAWDFSSLRDRVTAYEVLNEIHYKYYLFHGNMLVALAFTYAARRVSLGDWSIGWLDAGFLLLAVLYFSTSRDNLRKYYTRVARLLGTDEEVSR